jgi:hypothetical protein
MKRNLLTAVGIMVLALAVPSAALAHHGHGHHHHKAKAHHAKFRIVHIGASATTPASTVPSATAPSTLPAPENAGTVSSYVNGVLTLTLNDNSTVSGKVTNDTSIECIKASTAPAGDEQASNDQSQGDDNGQGDDQSRGDMSEHGAPVSGASQDEHGDGGDGEAPSASEPPCDSSALVKGAIVRAAELRIGPGGGEFESVWLVS